MTIGPTGRNEELNRQIAAATAEYDRIATEASRMFALAGELRVAGDSLRETADRLRAEIQKAIAR